MSNLMYDSDSNVSIGAQVEARIPSDQVQLIHMRSAFNISYDVLCSIRWQTSVYNDSKDRKKYSEGSSVNKFS